MLRQKSLKRADFKKHRILVLALAIILLFGAYLVYWHAHRPKTPVAISSSSKTTTKPHSEPSWPASSPPPAFNKNQFSTTDPSSPWVIVNKQHPLNPKDYVPSDLISVGNGQYMRAAAATALSQMLDAANSAGYNVNAASGYRSYSTQVSVYASEVKSYGQAVADSESARPGYSEHQTGWAVDLASGGCNIQDCFGGTPGGSWITNNAYKYGFILRYPAADVSTTGYRAESWHFRYVGTELSQRLHEQGVATLESFFGVSGGDY